MANGRHRLQAGLIPSNIGQAAGAGAALAVAAWGVHPVALPLRPLATGP